VPICPDAPRTAWHPAQPAARLRFRRPGELRGGGPFLFVIWSSSPATAAVFASFLVRSPAAHVQLPVACAQLAVQVNTGACG